jgi:cyanophycin synthetase
VELIDSRRLTGLNLQGPKAGAVVEVQFQPGEDIEACLTAWQKAVDCLCEALGWAPVPKIVRRYEGGASLVLEAPIDVLYATTEINEWAVQSVSSDAPALDIILARVRASIEEESNPPLLALEAACQAHGIPFVWDDDEVSVGMGLHSQVWSSRNLPEVSDVPWEQLSSVPVAYVTGTNGKTTTTRMTAQILRAAGLRPGTTSSDGVVVDGKELEQGDWTGTGAARLVLRHPEVDIAILETARGGLLRRGLVTDTCDAALITNIANDHMGEYGIVEMEDMAEAKGVVCRAVRAGGRRILNADDSLLRSLGQREGPPVCWFSLHPPTDWLQNHLVADGDAWVQENGWVVFCSGSARTPILPVVEIPACHGGAAQHNVANALGAAALSHVLGASFANIKEGLSGFGSTVGDNPGRCHIEEHRGVRLLLDFGHNPHGVRAILAMANLMRGENERERLCVSVGQAGDRSDEDLYELAKAVQESEPDRVSLREVPGYERGRAAGEVAAVMRSALLSLGQPDSSIIHHADEVSAMADALDWATEGDLVLHLVHMQRDAVREFLDARFPETVNS